MTIVCFLGWNRFEKGVTEKMHWPGMILWIVMVFWAWPSWCEEGKGALVLSFDDGYPSWIQTIAPELAKVGGKATAFVNNQRVHNRFVSFEDLRTLQNTYRWEIGTHTYHHHNAVEFVKRYGGSRWQAEELDRSLKELTAQGLQIRYLAFPFNVFDSVLLGTIKDRIAGFRRWEDFPVAAGKRADGSFPGRSIDLAGSLPLNQLFEWVDYVAREKKILFLYGHEVLPDDRFWKGRVVSVGPDFLLSEEAIGLEDPGALCLVADQEGWGRQRAWRVKKIEGKTVFLDGADSTRKVKAGSPFLLGPCYGTPLSYFQQFIAFSAGRLRFLTTSEALNGEPLSTEPSRQTDPPVKGK